MPGVQKVNILLVDDQPGNLLAHESILAELGENIVKASSGREALEHLLRQDFAVIARRPSEQGEEIDEHIGQVALSLVLHDGGGAVAFAESLLVGAEN